MLDLAKGNKQFAAIDRAIGKDSFRVVLLLRLSPLLPLALSNYLYGLTSVDLVPYVLGSWVGMLPGTLAYVTAGASLGPTALQHLAFRLRSFDHDTDATLHDGRSVPQCALMPGSLLGPVCISVALCTNL